MPRYDMNTSLLLAESYAQLFDSHSLSHHTYLWRLSILFEFLALR